jgi:hypothetical protein
MVALDSATVKGDGLSQNECECRGAEVQSRAFASLNNAICTADGYGQFCLMMLASIEASVDRPVAAAASTSSLKMMSVNSF